MPAASSNVTTCTNCSNAAKYTLGDANNIINYCGDCLPAHFSRDASAGLFPVGKS